MKSYEKCVITFQERAAAAATDGSTRRERPLGHRYRVLIEQDGMLSTWDGTGVTA